MSHTCAKVWVLLIVMLRYCATERYKPAPLPCRHERCKYVGYDINDRNTYKIDDNRVTVTYDDGNLDFDCDNADVLGSEILPRVDPPQRVSSVSLVRCPVPATVHELEALLPPSLRMFQVLFFSMKQLPVLSGLEVLKVSYWSELKPALTQKCESLRELYLVSFKAMSLPDGWLANCSRLEMIHTEYANNLITLSPKLFIGMKALKHLDITWGTLETLPQGLLDYSPNLRTLNLRINRLKTLPSDLFSVARQVQQLDLFGNDLKNNTLGALTQLKELINLDLKKNLHLGDVCGLDGYSMLRYSIKLKELLLSNTNVNRICRDWIEDMPQLEMLELTETNVSEVMIPRSMKAKVVTINTPVTVVKMTREDYNDAARGLASNVSVVFSYHTNMYPESPQLEQQLECDCRLYWMRRVLDLSLPLFQSKGELRCTDGRLVSEVPLDELMCTQPNECTAAALPSACTCVTRPDHNLDDDRILVRVRCENATLTHIPRPRAFTNSTKRNYELLLANNKITSLHAEDLPHNIKVLDLRNNSLSTVDEKTATRIGDSDLRLRLAGNPLECSCGIAPLLYALRGRDPNNTDWENATCIDGTSLYAADIAECSTGLPLVTWFAIIFTALALFVIVVVACLASRSRRLLALAVLHRCGCVCLTTEENDNLDYDLFVTFSHVDSATVRDFIARLEPPYRLCVHYRDWIPGRLITEQIVESVRQSRRTVALVSRHFLASSWARTEFREAYAAAMLDAKPRLIVVFLEDPAVLQIDDQLRSYIATYTYLRWGEVWFWDKLAVAMPRPRLSTKFSPNINHHRITYTPNEHQVEIETQLTFNDIE